MQLCAGAHGVPKGNESMDGAREMHARTLPVSSQTSPEPAASTAVVSHFVSETAREEG